MKIYAAKLTDTIGGFDLNPLYSRLTRERRQRIKNFVKKEDAQRSALAELVLKYAIRENLTLDQKLISFGYNEYGKPFLINKTNFHYNISHSGQWVVCVVDSSPVGIDIEMISTFDYDITYIFLGRDEYQDLMAQKEAERPSYFYSLWTLKESYLKALGKGLMMPLNSFSIKIRDGGIISLVTENAPGVFFLKQYDLDKNYKMSVCAVHNEFPKEIIVRDWEYYL